MKTLLIIDDETGIVDEVKSYFEEEGYQVFTAETVREGIRKYEEVTPDILIVDIKLPDQSGLEVLKYSKTKNPSVKVIVNTGYVDQHTIDEAGNLGGDAFLQKPFNLERLHEEINRLSP